MIDWNMARQHQGKFTKNFLNWLEMHEEIYRDFERESDRVYRMGIREYSARTIVEFNRHTSTKNHSRPETTISNHFISDMARLYLMNNPDKKEFFSVRSSGRRENFHDIEAEKHIQKISQKQIAEDLRTLHKNIFSQLVAS